MTEESKRDFRKTVTRMHDICKKHGTCGSCPFIKEIREDCPVMDMYLNLESLIKVLDERDEQVTKENRRTNAVWVKEEAGEEW